MLSAEGLVIMFIVLLGFPLIAMETRKFPKMKFIFLGYLCIVVASLFATRMIPGSTDYVGLARSLCIMASGILFGAGAYVSNKRMMGVLK
jgi:hypothetical protein